MSHPLESGLTACTAPRLLPLPRGNHLSPATAAELSVVFIQPRNPSTAPAAAACVLHPLLPFRLWGHWRCPPDLLLLLLVCCLLYCRQSLHAALVVPARPSTAAAACMLHHLPVERMWGADGNRQSVAAAQLLAELSCCSTAISPPVLRAPCLRAAAAATAATAARSKQPYAIIAAA
jgi:hypothetical protein